MSQRRRAGSIAGCPRVHDSSPDRARRNRFQLLKPISLLSACLLLVVGNSASAFTARDAETMVQAFNSAFYAQSGSQAHFRVDQSGGVSFFWTQAEMIECVIDAYEWTGEPAYLTMITSLLNGFLSQNGSDWGWNIYNDDIMWATLAFARGGVATGNTGFCDIAKANFDLCYARAWDNVVGGGLYWRTDNQTKNAASNGNAAIAAYLLYQIYGDTNYLDKANAIYDWERSALFNADTGLIADYIDTSGVVHGGATTYNQGTFIGAGHFLGHTNDARLAVNFTMIQMTHGGILTDYDIGIDNSGFNAIFLRWMTRFIKDRGVEETYGPWLQLNAEAAWQSRRTTDHLAWCDWTQPTPDGVNLGSWDCISSFEAMLAAQPTEGISTSAVPADAIGYWPLDATNGTVAVDATGNGNDGTVAGASWNPAGRLGGCLEFDGVNDSVQIDNPVSGDFTIVFWVNTTQSAGTPQWYHGAGLVDGDVPFVDNDFGTALVSNKFAFGVGNPDETVVSTTAINDGAWHLCVATRERATGTIRVYVDGVLEAAKTGSRNALDAPSELLFGAIASGGGYFNGKLDEIRIFARTLSGEEVAALYQSSMTSPAAAPTHLTAIAHAGQVQLNWWEAPLAERYHVKRSLITGGPYETLTHTAATRCTDPTVLNNRTYYYVVSSENSVGGSADSAELAVNTSTPTAWFRAEAITGLADGAPVSLWSDATGHGNDARQTLSANRPTYVAGAVNGLPAVRFNSGDNTYLWCFPPIQDDFTVIMVYQSSQGIGGGTGFWTGAGLLSGEKPFPVDDFAISLNGDGRLLAGTGNPDTSLQSGTGYNDGQPHIVTFKRTRSSGAIRLYVDGNLAGSGTGGTQSLNSPSALVMGAQATLENYLDGDIAEVMIYSTVLSEPDRFFLERLLRCKYGLPGGTAPPPPTGLTGVAGNREVLLNWILGPGATSYTLSRSTNNGSSFQVIATGLTASSYVDTNAASGQMNLYRIAATNGCGASAESAPFGVFLPLPKLDITLGAGWLKLSWAAWASDWQLYATTNLAPPVAWIQVPEAVETNGDWFNVTVPIDSIPHFFRLSSP